ncbi:MAG TPA: potassium channel protein [Acidimicrobiales bacterium]|nr:potassium channel protein [Acidimicrobiales bacterium]
MPDSRVGVRIRAAATALTLVVLGGTLGYWALGFSPLDAVYQTVTTITTVGFREVHPLTTAGKVFTIVLILVGVGTALYTFGVLLEALIEGQLAEMFGRRRMERKIAGMSDHVVVCGWGRVGRVIADRVSDKEVPLVVVDIDASRVANIEHPAVVGDATDDAVLREAGIDRARALVAAMSSDADNLYVTLSGRTLRPDIFIVARARVTSSEEKLLRAGANRVVNPQAIGGSRIAALLLQPHVSEFLDVVSHGGDVEFRLEEVRLPTGSPLAGQTLRDSRLRARTGALVLALRQPDGSFITNPSPDTVVTADQVLIAIGTETQLGDLTRLVESPTSPTSLGT